MSESAESPAQCRLCGAPVHREFSLQILGKYQVGYLLCSACGSLQTEPAHWLPEAYASHLASLDTGAAQRTLTNLAASVAASRILRLNDVLDFGGGDGLLCRLLRDYRINCFVVDKYARVTYAAAYTRPDFGQPGLLLAFEVVEHFENPRTDLEALFVDKPAAILASTTVYAGQGSDWWYLTPETGQHLFFYSRAALTRIAHDHGYALLLRGYYFLLVKAEYLTLLRRLALTVTLSRPVLRLLGALLRLSSTSGVTRDFDALRQKARR